MDSCIKDRAFSFNGDTVIDASLAFETDAFSISDGYAYSIICDMIGLDADPFLTVQGSNDGVNFTNPYSIVTDAETGDVKGIKTLLTAATSPLDPDAVDSVKDQLAFPYRFIRVKYDPNGVTSGTIKFNLALVNI